jgi:perosamine synthetase
LIPRLKPFLNHVEIGSIFRHIPDAVSRFENEFAKTFKVEHAIAFPYGRSALWAFFKAQNIQNAEVILPAYTCSVVAHGIVLSQNTPRFVDICLSDYNMDLDQVSRSINERTKAIIATHLFGYPLDIVSLAEIVRQAERKYGHKIWVIQDCAHSFDSSYKGKSVISQPDVSLFGLNISKQITSIFGGMLTTNDDSIALALRSWRQANFIDANVGKSIRRIIYLLSVYPAFFEPFYGLTYFLQYETPLLNRLTKAYHLDQEIHFPPGFDDFMLPIEAKVGLAQLQKYETVIRNRRENAAFYGQHVSPHSDWAMPPLIEGATYSHYAIRVPDRDEVMRKAAKKGLHLGELIEYCIPEIGGYQKFTNGQEFPNSSLCSRSMINLPIYASLSHQDREKVVKIINLIV